MSLIGTEGTKYFTVERAVLIRFMNVGKCSMGF